MSKNVEGIWNKKIDEIYILKKSCSALIAALLFNLILLALPLSAQVKTGTEDNPAFRFVKGASSTSSTNFSDIPDIPQLSGYRVYCRVSHMAYGDPISKQDSSRQAYFHTYIGNTTANEYSTKASIATTGNSSCSGGMGGTYWKPTVFDSRSQPVVPRLTVLSFKSHQGKEHLRTIPNGLTIEASNSNLGCEDDRPQSFKCTRVEKDQDGSLLMRLYYPNCLATNNDGSAVLSSTNNSHGAFGYYQCPDSHPYRIPMMITNYFYPLPFESDWSLSTAVSKKAESPGQESFLIGGAITSFTSNHDQDILECIKKSQNCELSTHSADEVTSLDGTTMYSKLEYMGNSTPIGSLDSYRATKAEPIKKVEIVPKLQPNPDSQPSQEPAPKVIKVETHQGTDKVTKEELPDPNPQIDQDQLIKDFRAQGLSTEQIIEKIDEEISQIGVTNPQLSLLLRVLKILVASTSGSNYLIY